MGATQSAPKEPSNSSSSAPSNKRAQTNIPEFGVLAVGATVTAYFKLPDGKQSATPFNGVCEELGTKTAGICFDFGVKQHIPRTWIVNVDGEPMVKPGHQMQQDYVTVMETAEDEQE